MVFTGRIKIEWSTRSIAALTSLVVPIVLWPLVFRSPSDSFWLGLAIATSILLSISLTVSRGLGLRTSIRWLLLGVASGILLYVFFYVGFEATKGLAPFSGGVSSVYLLKGNSSPLLIGLLLIFPIGPGEEIYWRGLIQSSIGKIGIQEYAWILQAIPYTLIHLFTLNPPLLITALIGGLSWGYLYRLSGSITPSILSHVIFDLFIFVVLPFR